MIDSRSIFRYLTVFIFGGLIYTSIELLFRGSSHWTMTLTGGVCFLSLYLLAIYTTAPLWKKTVWGAVIITGMEFVVGIIVNKILGWNIWDYADCPMNFMGQICIGFSAIWILFSAGGIMLCEVIYKFQCWAEKKYFRAGSKGKTI